MKLRSFTVLLLTFSLLLSLSACGGSYSAGGPVPSGQGEESPKSATLTERWKVCKVDEASLLAFPERDDGTAGELCDISLSNVDETNGKLQPGVIVEVVYDGYVLETWPGQINNVKSVTVVEQGEDFMTFYLDILDGLYKAKPDMNPEDSMETSITYGLDLSGVHNLSTAEKEVLGYLFTCAHDTDWKNAQPAGYVLGTYEELAEKGYIDSEKSLFEDGILFTIEDEPAKDGKFSFAIKKWRSGDDDFGFRDCNAEKKDGAWSSTLLSFLSTYEDNLVTQQFKVCSVNEYSILAYKENENYDGLYSIPLNNVDETKGKLWPGATVEVVYTDIIQMTAPAKIPGVESITVVEQGEDFMTLYLDILDELYETDPGLNPEGSMEVSITYGLDLSGVHNLSEVEKGILANLFTNAHDTDWEKAQPAGFALGTYEELVEEGYIDGESLFFKDGVFFTITDEPVENGKFTFSAEKWRSGLGAISYTDSRAEKKDGVWTYELDGFAIS